MPKSREIEVGERSAPAAFRPTSWDEKTGSVEMVFSTGERVMRTDWRVREDGPFWEELSLEPGAVNLRRLNSGRANVLDNHGAARGSSRWDGSAYQIGNILGVIEGGSVKVQDVEGQRAIVGRARFSNRAEVAGVRQDVRDGVLSQASLGYLVYRYQFVETAAGGVPVYRAIDWEPKEVSLTAVPAEAGAHVRHADGHTNPCLVDDERAETQGATPVTVQPKNADKKTEPAAATTEASAADQARTDATKPAPTAAEEVAAVRAATDAARVAERSRVLEIQGLSQRAGLKPEAVRSMIDEGTPLEAARAAILEKWAAAPAERPSVPAEAAGSAGRREGEDDAIIRALMHRGMPALMPAKDLTEQARAFCNYSLLDLARHTLERRGVRAAGLDRMGLATRAMESSSDFPELLANTANKTLRASYDIQPNTWQAICKVGSLNDFKVTSRPQLGGAPALEKVPESGAVARGAVGEQAEKYKLETYAKIVPLTRQAIINDDLSAFTQIPAQFAISAAVLIEDIVYGILTTNANMADGVALFNSAHGNLQGAGAGSALSVGGLSAARVLLRNQKGLDNKFLNLPLMWIVVPTALETTAEQLIAPLQAITSGGVNPFAGKLRHIAQPRLDANSLTAWYAFTDPARCDTIEVGFLNGQAGPRIETDRGFDVEGMEIKCALDVGAKAIDWRGMAKSPGA